jgi:hypothetical protein
MRESGIASEKRRDKINVFQTIIQTICRLKCNDETGSPNTGFVSQQAVSTGNIRTRGHTFTPSSKSLIYT